MTSPLVSPLLDELVARVAALRAAAAGRRVLLGIAGAPGAGKSHLAGLLLDRLADGDSAAPPDAVGAAVTVPRPAGVPRWAGTAVAHVPMDGFHLADVELLRLGRADRKGAPDTFDPAGYAALLRRVAAGEQVWAPAFDRTLEQPVAQSLPVTAATRVVISEGNYLLLDDPQWRAVRAVFDEVWFCETDEARRVELLVARHVRFGKTPEAARRWVAGSDAANARLVAATRDRADLVIDTAGLPSN